jgi:cyanophycinase
MELQSVLKSIVVVFCLIIQVLPKDKGHLVIIGGGRRDKYLMERFIELAGGKNSKIIVIPMASSVPIETANYQVEELKKLGCPNADYIYCARQDADNDSTLTKLDGVSGVFFSGGDQSNLTKELLGTKLLEKIKIIYKEGGVIGGTSAGAAVMSKVMITGDELINKDSTNIFSLIKKGNVKLAEGFGFIQSAIIDQHFITRKRLTRLIEVVLENPELLGIGIDESTAIIINPDDTFDVLGENTVMVLNAKNSINIKTDKNDNLSADDIRMHLLKSGDKYDLKNNKIIYSK